MSATLWHTKIHQPEGGVVSLDEGVCEASLDKRCDPHDLTVLPKHLVAAVTLGRHMSKSE